MDRFNAQFVPKGYNQTNGVDYAETFSSVAKLNTDKIIISLAATFNWELHQLEVKRTHFFMVICKKRLIWCSHLDLLLRGSPLKCAS